MSSQPLTFAELLEAFREIKDILRENAERVAETDRKYAEQKAETDRKIQENADQMRETDRRIDKLTSNMGNVELRIGDLVEHMIGGKNVITQFQALGYDVNDHSRNIVFGVQGTAASGQIDLLLDDGDVAILVEVKTNLKNDDILDHIERLEKYRQWKDRKGESKKRYIGALACAMVKDNVVRFAQKNGMYVIVQLGCVYTNFS